ncbi:MAG TPA: asparagine synthase (glutamine-hydrolyzing) [Terriglobia bacterium]|nr:asparagine synthase (glutamine-hydrolyzing) [Terriglobia bacterium]
MNASAPLIESGKRCPYPMCGICGIFNLSLAPLAHPERIGAMTARLIHRGPDSEGRLEKPHLVFAIRRLKIIDLETGDQPLYNETGDVALVFNGEIYNFRELRQGLEERGHRFRTHSDGEVIAHLYEEKGPGCLEDLNGMFAIALWDERGRRLLLARDRAGEKPLYYWQGGGTLAFASEIKSLIEYPEVPRQPDFEAWTSYFLHGYIPAPRSAFQGIQKLPAAHRMVVDRGRISIEPYWRLADHLRPPGSAKVGRAEEESLARELRDRVRQAAVSRLVSDVPLGVFLSGGLDSSTLVALMSELAPEKVSSFSVSFADPSFNEEPYSTLVAERFRTRHHVLQADTGSLREALDVMVNHLDEPLADPAVLPTFLISRFARSEITVALSGEGSDELFGGYPTYVGSRLADYYLRLPHALRHAVFEPLGRRLRVSPGAVPLGLFLRRFLENADKPAAERHLIWFGMFAPSELDGLLAAGWPGPRPDAAACAPLARVLAGARFESTLAEMLYLDFRTYLEDNLLVKVDRASMACSLELRTPFLDHRLVEFAAGLPASIKLRHFRMKHILKKAVEPWLPRAIVNRQKRGFSVPIAAWMRQELRPLIERTLSPDKLKRQGWFDAGYVRRLLDEHWSGRADHRKPIWTLLCFELWRERWMP